MGQGSVPEYPVYYNIPLLKERLHDEISKLHRRYCTGHRNSQRTFCVQRSGGRHESHGHDVRAYEDDEIANEHDESKKPG